MDSFAARLMSPDFYAEGMGIALSFALAWLLAALVRRRAGERLANRPPKFVTPQFAGKSLALIAPLLALVFLTVFRPVIERHDGGDITRALIVLTVAYLAARFVMLLVQSRLVAYFIGATVMTVAALQVTGLLSPLTAYLESVEFHLGTFEISLRGLVGGLIILVVVFWMAGAVSRSMEHYLRRTSSLNYNTRELIVKFFKLFVYFLAFTITLSAMGVDLTAFAVFGGALGVGIGLGLQKITSNFLSGITLLAERSIRIGDLIDVADISGWVRQLNVRYTLVEAFDGREIMIPNEELASTRVTNWTHSNNRARVEAPVGVAYGSDVKLVQKLMLEAAAEHPLCLKDPEPKCWLREFADSSINFLLVFWVPDVRDGRYGPQSDVMFSILEKFDKHGIEIPFPQRVVRLQEMNHEPPVKNQKL